MNAAAYEIFPAIGIARVGNAPEAFYICPEEACGLQSAPMANPLLTRTFATLMAGCSARPPAFASSGENPASLPKK